MSGGGSTRTRPATAPADRGLDVWFSLDGRTVRFGDGSLATSDLEMRSSLHLTSLRLEVSARDQKAWKPDGGGGEDIQALYDHIKRRGLLVEERRTAKGDRRQARVGIQGLPINCICCLGPTGTPENGRYKGDLTLTIDAPLAKFTLPESDRVNK